MTAKTSLTALSTLTLLVLLCTSGAAHAQDAPGDAPKADTAKTDPAGDQEAQKEREEADKADEQRDERNARLADRIKSVQRKVFLKRERIELYPYVGLDLNDPFFQHFLVGASLSYHVVDSIALEVRGGYAVARIKQKALEIARQAEGIVLENAPEFKYHADLDFGWAPFYGKISLLGEGILHFDTYVSAGPGIFGTDAGVNPALNVGIGQRYYINRWLTARIELRDYIFIDNRPDQSSVQNLLVFGASISGFFPTSFEYEFQ